MTDEQIKEIIIAMLNNGKFHGKINDEAASVIVSAIKILKEGIK